MLKINNINKSYGSKNIINSNSFAIPKGSTTAFIGPNGAGKTTILRMLNLITKPDSGTIEFNGKILDYHDLKLIGYMPEEKGLYQDMEVFEQLVYFAKLRDLTNQQAKNKTNYWLDKFDMQKYAKIKVKALSKGNQQKIQFIVSIIHEPKFLILDEPLSGLDPINSELIDTTIKELKEKGVTILFSTHRMEQVESICDHIIMINEGKILISDSIENIKNEYSTNQIKVQLNNDPSYVKNILKKNLIDYYSEKNDNSYIINLNDKTNKELLDTLINNKLEIISYQQSNPSIKDIFFKLLTK
jgi:ABC-2 type transport system ATP-binding protein